VGPDGAGPIGEVLAGVGWVGSGTAGAGWGRLGRRRPGRSGSDVTEAVRGQAWPGWLGSSAAGAGPGAVAARGAVGGVGGACRYTACGRDAREREAGERKGGVGYTRLCSSSRHISRRT
jgi:hypothetical protein